MYYLTSEAVELLEAYRGPGKGRSKPGEFWKDVRHQAGTIKPLAAVGRSVRDITRGAISGAEGDTKSQKLGSMVRSGLSMAKRNVVGFGKGALTPADKFSLGARQITRGEYAGAATRKLAGKARRVLGRTTKALARSGALDARDTGFDDQGRRIIMRRRGGNILRTNLADNHVYARIGDLLGERVATNINLKPGSKAAPDAAATRALVKSMAQADNATKISIAKIAAGETDENKIRGFPDPSPGVGRTAPSRRTPKTSTPRR